MRAWLPMASTTAVERASSDCDRVSIAVRS